MGKYNKIKNHDLNITFPIAIISNNIKFEFQTTLIDDLMLGGFMKTCPNCHKNVDDKNGICSSCRENIF